ncbi:hypothetical protein EP331_13765 [bacterium]|nr:MAG: hypothetical protein EP331_13765 [bacterium]
MRNKLLFLLFLLLLSSNLTAQDSSKVEWIKVYFNMPGDSSLSFPGNTAHSNQNLVHTLTSLIDNASFSVDLCVYDMEHPDLAHSLANAKKRGLRVRVVTDNFNRTDGKELDVQFLAILAKAGIYSIDDDGDVYTPDGQILDNKKPNAGTDMHHKFAIIDYISPTKEDDLVWTGSTNMTYTGNYNTNTTLVIKDSQVAETYTREFETMWGGSDDLPDAKRAAFHKDKPLHSKPVHWVGDTKVEIYFSPLDRDKTKPLVSDKIVQVIKNEAQHDVAFSAFSITPGISISNALWDLEEKQVQLRGVISNDFYSRYKKQKAIWASAAAQSGGRMIYPSNELRKLHHKTIIIDAESPDSADVAVTITGSYNFSNNADYNNDENILIIYSDSIANVFLQDFGGIWNRANGTWQTPKPDVEMNTLYNVHAGRDANSVEIEVVPGFYYPVYLAGIKAPWSYRGKDSTTYFAQQAKDFLHSLVAKNKVRFDTLSFNEKNGKLFGRVMIGSFDVGLALIQKGMAEKTYSEAISASVANSYSEATKDAQEKQLGMWASPGKAWSVIATESVDEKAALSENPININEADEYDFTQLPGIGPTKAKAIVEYRDKNGAFTSIDDLAKVKGIGPKTVIKLRPFITTQNKGDNE